MTVKKVKNGTWTIDISDGFHPVTKKRIRIIRKGFKTKKEALDIEQYIRVVELREKRFDFLVTTDMLFNILEAVIAAVMIALNGLAWSAASN